ncbi:GNAT family N-acetyltransferase [Dactylosporangium sp. NPDC049140]|uniref:GNAT family N-acetyltransferase n=1 Tax=Dactylosporangium sp. NPDC049140 TaxID=3155647 RepID=UPI0033FDDA41
MLDDLLLQRARRLWAGLAGTPVVFRDAAVEVVVSPQSSLCPPGWVGIVALGGAVIVTAPDGDTAETVRRAFADLPTMAELQGTLPIDETLGPATLAYCDAAGFRPAGAAALEKIPADHADLKTLIARVPADDADESGLAEVTSPVFVVRTATEVVAAAGYRAWPGDTAHLSVLTAPAQRGRGLARAVATAAVADALRSDLLPQWRARPEASRRVARALGFRELGSQLSIHLRSV